MLDITQHVRAGYPAVAIETFEDSRFCELLLQKFPKRQTWLIAATGGLKDLRDPKKGEPTTTYPKAFERVAKTQDSFLVVLDFQHIIQNAPAYRALLLALAECKANGSMIILLSPAWTMPPELQHEVPVLRDVLPTPEELSGALGVVLEATQSSTEKIGPAATKSLLSSARGLTMNEAENAFALSSLSGLKPTTVEDEKLRLVKSKCMTVEKPRPVEDLGGLGRLKDYISHEVLPARDDELLRVRGLILVGVPGTGKSLAARVIASILSWPLVRLDIAAAKGSLVGESEATLRNALGIVDAIAPCVLWVDEIEKAVGGYASSASTDGGTTLGMVGALLTWMQEHTSPVLLVATCNDFHKMPPEMSRAGRMDERFFLDLPTSVSERVEIANIHLRKLGVKADGLPALVANVAEEFTGAEIEQLVKSAARRTGRKITKDALESAAREIVPISRSANIKDLREWAKEHLRRANDDESAPAKGRRIQ